MSSPLRIEPDELLLFNYPNDKLGVYRIINVCDLPMGIIDISDQPNGIIDIGNLPDEALADLKTEGTLVVVEFYEGNTGHCYKSLMRILVLKVRNRL